MNSFQIYILISIIALAGIMFTLILTRKKMRKPLTPLTGIAFAFVLAGIIFGENQLIGYGLTGIGIILAVIDIIKKSKAKS